jgi:hypothetical protein
MDTLLTLGVVGALLAAVTAMHLHLTARRLLPVLDRPSDEIDAEFFRIIGAHYPR